MPLGIDLITLTLVVVLAACILFLLAPLVPQLSDLMGAAGLEGDTLVLR